MDLPLKLKFLCIKEGGRLGLEEGALEGGLVRLREGDAVRDLMGLELGELVVERKFLCSSSNLS